MRNLFRSDVRFFKTWTATGLMPVVLLTGLPGCVARHMPDWSRVQAVAPETKTEVQLYEDEAVPGGRRRKLKGRFISATADSITLQLTDRNYTDDPTRTLQKSAVRKVLTRRPFLKRWPGWVALGIFGLLNAGYVAGTTDGGEDSLPGHLVLQGGVTLPLAIGFFFGSRMEGIYEVPPKHRDPPWWTGTTAGGTEKPKASP